MLKKMAAITCFLFVTFFAFQAFAIDLTGTWVGDDGSTYFITQIGSEVWWFGESSDVNPQFTTTAHGNSDDTALLLTWVDVPKGIYAQSGLLGIHIWSEFDLELVYASGGFGFTGMHWRR